MGMEYPCISFTEGEAEVLVWIMAENDGVQVFCP